MGLYPVSLVRGMRPVTLLMSIFTLITSGGVTYAFSLVVNVSSIGEEPLVLTEGDLAVTQLNVSCPDCPERGISLELSPRIAEDSVARVVNFTFSRDESAGDWRVRGQVLVEGIFLGKTQLYVDVLSSSGEAVSIRGRDVHVLRGSSALDTAFTVCVAVLVAINTVAFSCNLDLKVVVEHLKKPTAVGIGFVCQYVFMPVIAFGMARAFNLPPNIAFGLFCYGSSPGGGFSNVYTILLRGDLNLSVSMTLASTMASLAMTTLWLLTLGRVLASNITIPYQNILISLGSLVVTCIIGLLIGKFAPKVSRVLQKAVKPLAGIIILFILTFGIYSNSYIFRLMGSWRVALSAISVSWLGYLLSLVLALLLRRPWKIVRTIVIETGVQNGGVAIVILRYSLPQPDADLATVAPTMALMTSGLPLLLAIAITMIVRRVRKRKEAKSKDCDEILSNGGVDHVTAPDKKQGQGHTNISFVAGSAASLDSIRSCSSFQALNYKGRVMYESGI